MPSRQEDSLQRRPRVSEAVERLVLDMSFHHPSRGQDRIARDLWSEKVRISASGVRYIWQRNNLETLEKRIAWIESRLGRDDQGWSSEQLAARDRVRNNRQSRSLGAGMAGSTLDEVPRSMYILAVAARLFRERSVDAVSLRDIAVSAQIPVGSIYYHYPTKEELFAAVYEEGIRRLDRAIKLAVCDFTDPWDRLEKACAAHLMNLCGGDDFTAVSIPTKLPNLSPLAHRHARQLNETYEKNFRNLIKEIPLNSRTSPTVFRLQLLGALNWTSIWYRPDKMHPQSIAKQLISSFRYGVLE